MDVLSWCQLYIACNDNFTEKHNFYSKNHEHLPGDNLETVNANDDLIGKPIEFEAEPSSTVEASTSLEAPDHSVTSSPVYANNEENFGASAVRKFEIPAKDNDNCLVVPTILVQEPCESGTEGDLEADLREDEFEMGKTNSMASNIVSAANGTVSKATIAVSDVDGRAFDILLR